MVLGRNTNKLSFVILSIETLYVAATIVEYHHGNAKESEIKFAKWDCSGYLDDKTGKRLIEEIMRRTLTFIENFSLSPNAICLILPGTLQGTSTVLNSNRLCICEPLNVSDFFFQRSGLRTFVLHDTECLGVGEANFGSLKEILTEAQSLSCYAYLLVDEGVGSTLFINGKAFKGAGSAGHLGRLVVDPHGQYNPTFLSRGSLEVYASRPWVSKNIVGGFLSEKGKNINKEESSIDFKNFIYTASQMEEKWNTLPYWVISKGIECRDPIVMSVIEDAAMYLGLAINCILSVAHPSAIIIGGEMIKQLPGFYDSVLAYARRFSWALAWNRTIIKPATLDRKAQLFGAAKILSEFINE